MAKCRDRVQRGRALLIPTYQYLYPYDEEDDMGYVEPTEKRAIIPPTPPPNFKFDITSAMIQLLNLKGIFWD